MARIKASSEGHGLYPSTVPFNIGISDRCPSKSIRKNSKFTWHGIAGVTERLLNYSQTGFQGWSRLGVSAFKKQWSQNTKKLQSKKPQRNTCLGKNLMTLLKVWTPQRFTWLRQYQHQTTVLFKESAFSGKIFLREATNVYQGTNTTNQEPTKRNHSRKIKWNNNNWF